ncbi:P1 family peptidase [Candidatus Bathyarchaeota archaeon]|nr:P1 family peptidase [Candidatus Bathyarchaeota archaeon]
MAASTLPTRQGGAARGRIRDVLPGLHLGTHKPGALNAVTDVPGVLVHTQSIYEKDGAVNTGVTTILPRKDWFRTASYAGIFRFNGAGEMTGSHWIEETGLLVSPVIITNSFAVGAAHQGVFEYAIKHYSEANGDVEWGLLPVVAETYDGFLNDLSTFAVKPEHVVEGISRATGGPVEEGNSGGGTAMTCHGHKGGTGTSSRVVTGLAEPGEEKAYTVGALVQANYGKLHHLRISGAPVGRIIAEQREKAKEDAASGTPEAERAQQWVDEEKAKDKKDGSIIIVLATDAPLHPLQLQRLAKRATTGLARVGGYGHNPSGDIFLAFSTANEIPSQRHDEEDGPVDPFKARTLKVEVTDDASINALFEASADAVEEAIYNALCGAETMTGRRGNTAEALDLENLKEIMERYM